MDDEKEAPLKSYQFWRKLWWVSFFEGAKFWKFDAKMVGVDCFSSLRTYAIAPFVIPWLQVLFSAVKTVSVTFFAKLKVVAVAALSLS